MAHCRWVSWAGAALAGSMLVSAPAPAARPQGDADPDPVEKNPAESEGKRDDPRARREAMRMWRGEPDAAARWGILQEALKERDHYGAVRLSAPVAGSVFINVGPTRADVEYNGGNYTEIDSGRARQIVPHPTNPNILYMATSGGGVWKSYDQGAGWEPMTDSLGSLSIGTLAMDPSSPEVLYLGLGDPFDVPQPGIAQSFNGGATWSAPQLLQYSLSGTTYTAASVTDIKIDPTNSLIVLVTSDQGLFRSIDGGTSYSHVSLVGTASSDINFWMWSVGYVGAHTWLVSGERLDLTGTTRGGGMGLWRSIDDGVNWTWNGSALPGGDAEAAAAGRGTLATALSTVSDVTTSRIYLLAGIKGSGAFGGNATRDVYRSDDGGNSFISLRVNSGGRPTNPNVDQTDLNVLHEQAWYNQAITVDPTNADAVFVGGNLAMIRSLDGGVTWSVLSDWLPGPTGIPRPYVHADFHAFAVGIDGTFYAGSDGGIFPSKNARSLADPASVTFTSARNEGLVTHLLYNVACAPDTWPSTMWGWMAGGTQDDGTRVRKGNTTTFDQLLGGDGIGLAVSGGVTSGVPNLFLASTPGSIYLSTQGGSAGSWNKFTTGMVNPPPFFVRIARDEAAATDTFLTYSMPAAMYRSVGGGNWVDISGTLHWTSDVQGGPATTAGFTTPTNTAISLRNVAAHPNKSGLYAAVSNKYAYVTTNGGTDWNVSVRAKVPTSIPNCPSCGAYLLSSIALDPTDQTGQTYYITSKSMNVTDEAGKNTAPMPSSFGHLYKTVDGGLSWTSLGTQATTQGGLPFVPIGIVKLDPADPLALTLYVGTDIGLYKSVDGGQNFARFGGGSLPDVEVTDVCTSAASKRLVVGTYGRGFWEISTDGSGDPAGVKGRGDTNFDFVVDGQDLIDLADAWGSTETSPAYRYQADLVGAANLVDDNDLTALLAKFGGQP